MKLLVFPGVSFLISCENDIEKIRSIADTSVYPDVSGRNIETLYSDSGKVRIQIRADEIKKFTTIKKPYVEFPKGMEVIFFNDSMNVSAEIIADYAIYYNEERLWEAKGNVIAKNLEKGESLYSEELFWDENKKKIYSNIFSRIENNNGTFYGNNGFEAEQDFSHWTLKGSRAEVTIQEQPGDESTPK